MNTPIKKIVSDNNQLSGEGVMPKHGRLQVVHKERTIEYKFFHRLYYQYTTIGLHTSAGQLLPHLCRLANETDSIDDFSRLVNDEILKLDSYEDARKLILRDIVPLVSTQRKKPVLIFHIYGWLYGGAERVISLISNYLSKTYQVIIAAFPPIENDSYKLDGSTIFIPLMGDHYSDGIERLVKLNQLLTPDVFIGSNNSIIGFIDIYRYLRPMNIKTIAWCHEYYFFPHNNPNLVDYAVVKNYALTSADAVCFLTNFSGAAYSLINNNAIAIPNPNTFESKADNYFNPDGETVIAVGRFNDAIKRLDRILLVFSKLLEKHPRARLKIVGPYDLSMRTSHPSDMTIEELIARLNLPINQLEFTGLIKDMSDVYQTGDVYIMASNNEGFPVTLTEAGVNGLPSVIFDIPGLEDIITDGENGYIVPQDDIESFAEKVAMLLSDAALRKRMSEKALLMASRFDTSLIGAKWEKLLHILLTDEENICNQLKEEFPINIKCETKFCERIIQEYVKYGIRVSQKHSIS